MPEWILWLLALAVFGFIGLGTILWLASIVEGEDGG
jgi:hypothetical protein